MEMMTQYGEKFVTTSGQPFTKFSSIDDILPLYLLRVLSMRFY